jgi:hypothetical protein
VDGTYDSHLTVFTPPPLGTVRMVPKKEVATMPQLGHGPFRIRASFKIVLVRAWAMKKVMGNTMNHVTTKLYGSGNCNVPTPADLSAL